MSSIKKPTSRPEGKGRCVVVGGFLGAGKTRAIARLGKLLATNGTGAGLVVDDHGTNLVDPVYLKSLGFEAEEAGLVGAAGGPHPMVEAAGRLMEGSGRGVVVGEAAGNHANLAEGTLLAARARGWSVAPLSVMADPARLFRLEGDGWPEEGIARICRTQLREAELIVVNKVDLLTPEKRTELRRMMARRFPNQEVLEVSAKTGEGFGEWVDRLGRETKSNGRGSGMDHEDLADAGSRLAWLNCAVRLSSRKYFEATVLLKGLALRLREALRGAGVEVEHLKLALVPDVDLGGIAGAHCLRDSFDPEALGDLPEPVDSGLLLLNLRGEGAPDRLNQATNEALLGLVEGFPQLFTRQEHLEYFRPVPGSPG